MSEVEKTLREVEEKATRQSEMDTNIRAFAGYMVTFHTVLEDGGVPQDIAHSLCAIYARKLLGGKV